VLLRPIEEGITKVVSGSRFFRRPPRKAMFFWNMGRQPDADLHHQPAYNAILSDMETCYKVFRAEVVKGHPAAVAPLRFEPEVTAKVLKRGYRILRSADLVQRARMERRQENLVERWRDRAVDSAPVSRHRLIPTRQRASYRTQSWASVFAPALVILTGLLLRIGMLGVDARFHPDEALFAAQARLIPQHGDLLLRETDLDKPRSRCSHGAVVCPLGPTEYAAPAQRPGERGERGRAVRLGRSSVPAAGGLAGGGPAVEPVAVWPVCPRPRRSRRAGDLWVLIAAQHAVLAVGRGRDLRRADRRRSRPRCCSCRCRGAGHGARARRTGAPATFSALVVLRPAAAGLALLVPGDAARAPLIFGSTASSATTRAFVRLIEVGRLGRWLRWLDHSTGSRALNFALVTGGSGRCPGRRSAGATAGPTSTGLIVGFAVAFLGCTVTSRSTPTTATCTP